MQRRSSSEYATASIGLLIFTNLNVDSISDWKGDQIKATVNVLVISETKIDDSFPTAIFLLDSLTSLKQRVKIDSSYSLWNEIKRGVPQGSILGPPLSNIFIHDICIFTEKSEICNFADDNIIYDCGEDLSNILENLKHDMKILLTWFRMNSLQGNLGKFNSIHDFREGKRKFGQTNSKLNQNSRK